MKLLIVTVVLEFEKEILKLFKKSNIDSFSESRIDGHKNLTSMVRTASWFPSEKGGIESSLFFSFTENENIDKLFQLIKEFNLNLETNNSIKAVVVPIEKSILS
ncbi:hypothetical protein [Maribacter hydrothermalis]|uniref:Nitrogen regulatory protein P-II n=1 Tax=Maribacter hydrothermalis TaxID=1836467 RepID=A0A1B7YZ94_9FLAO|nr:hypothetical protein [Maribacter hydrothermalis]APQ16107.1 hypothetical protein BTR34_01540 [Maribacter hydrothermalis]OBR35716.1 hypothetical protein A9200_10975 [Maribacter hydrothermalis]